MTRQREAILAVLAEAGRPLSPPQVLEAARCEVPSLGIATVYRALAKLVSSGELAEVELPGAATHYEPAGLDHHHHFHCDRCGRVYDLPGCPGNLERHLPRGFAARRHEVVLYGNCPRCTA